MANPVQYEVRIQQLEQELDEMTEALSHAWDQLVPFLQAVPATNTSMTEVHPLLDAVTVAADAELAGLYLFDSAEWLTAPHPIQLCQEDLDHLQQISGEWRGDLPTQSGIMLHWVFAPIIVEGKIRGCLGIGTTNAQRDFTAVDLRILERMSERIGSQIAAKQLALSREREAQQAHELQIARQIQQSIQPETTPPTPYMQLAAYWHPARDVGGDAWGWAQYATSSQSTATNQISWFLLDVAGKGLAAALAAVSMHTAISMALRMQLSPVEVLEHINDEFYDAYTRTDLLTTVLVARLDPKNHRLEVANAGHPPLLVNRKGAWTHYTATAPPIGVLPTLDVETQWVPLGTDDTIIAYSDGFTEITTPTGLWGQEGLMSSLPDMTQPVDELVDEVVRTATDAGTTFDDQTLLIARYTGQA